tara:strand:+ start:262 stop:729 length:468 start_codon:yes stop_codon:yes gene_type:complete
MNRKGAERIMSVWWFAILVVVAGTVGIMVALYYGSEVDVRGLEASILAEKVIKCLNNKGIVEDLVGECGLDAERFGQGSDYFLKVSVFDSSGNLINEIKEGQHSYEDDCILVLGDSGIGAKRFPRCVETSFDLNGQRVDILSGSNQIGRSVPYNE